MPLQVPGAGGQAAAGAEADRGRVDPEALAGLAHGQPLVEPQEQGLALQLGDPRQHRVHALLELLGAHGHVCVKINGARDADAVAKAAGELAGDGAVILLTKSNSVLYGKPQP